MLIVLVFTDIERGDILGEVVGVKVDEGEKKYPQLRCGERDGSIRKDALEGGLPRVLHLRPAHLLGLVFLLLALELGLAFLLLPLLELGLTLDGFFLCLLFG